MPSRGGLPSRTTMSVTAAEVVKVFEKVKDAAADADGNSASEDRCVDALKLLASMQIPLKLFTDGSIGEVPKAIKKMAKKGPTNEVRKAADACMTAWKTIITGGESSSGAKKAKEGDEKELEGAGEGEETDLKVLLQPATGDPLRDRTRELLAEAMVLCVGSKDVYASIQDVAQTAKAVEKAMYEKWADTGKEYKAKFRQLSFNLKDPKNPDLRRSVADGLIAPAVLLELSPEELGSDEQRAKNAQIREAATNEAVRGQKKEASTDAFKCGKCGKRQCTYYQLQTRSADEPMTTFVTCVNCDNRWKFC